MSEKVEDVVEVKVVKPDFKVRLSEKYAIDTDKLNIILLERYETRVGKGKDAPLSGLHSWRIVGFFQNLSYLTEWLVKHEMLATENVSELQGFSRGIEDLKNEILMTLTEKIVLKME